MSNEVPKETDEVSESLFQEHKEVTGSPEVTMEPNELTMEPNEVILWPKEVTSILNNASIWPNEVI